MKRFFFLLFVFFASSSYGGVVPWPGGVPPSPGEWIIIDPEPVEPLSVSVSPDFRIDFTSFFSSFIFEKLIIIVFVIAIIFGIMGLIRLYKWARRGLRR